MKSAEPSDLISFGSSEEGGEILVVGKVEFVASVAYSHANWDNAAYDSEDKRLIPFEDVEGVTEIPLEADFTMSLAINEDGEPVDIEEFQFRNDKFQWVDLYPYDLYEFM